MRHRLPALLAAAALLAPPATAHAQDAARARERARAARVTIVRDQWGVAHVYGKSDADAVFGMAFAQAEDDFNRVETNYINAMGRLAEVEGEREIWRDLRMKLFIDTLDMKAKYAASPEWLKELMVGWSDGLNHYLATHPQTKPRLLTRFAPWMALTFSEGSIGGDIESVSLRDLERFYGPRSGGTTSPASAGAPGGGDGAERPFVPEPGGSNGFALAPRVTATGHAMLMINPHTSFYFRPEIHVVSEAGLNAYGAVTWGQFFVYQGFNDRLGWMHTSGGGDVIDEYRETVAERGGRAFYRYGTTERPLRARVIGLPFRRPDGSMGRRDVTAYFAHHGPIVRGEDGAWVAVRLMQEEVKALQQSYLRTKARTYAEFAKVMDLRTNSSNNTVYADADGNIAYWHGNFLPKRDPSIDFTKPVDGSDPRTDWKGLHTNAEIITLKNPASGFLYNSNDWPWQAAGTTGASPDSTRFPKYMNGSGYQPRGPHAIRVLEGKTGFTLDGLIAAAYDSWLPAFEPMIPALARDWEALPASDTLRTALAEPVAALRGWDLRFGLQSVPTTVAHYWGEELLARIGAAARQAGVNNYAYMASPAAARARLEALARATARLTADFGTWRTPWGEVNRYQRLTGDIVQPNDDAKPSLPVPFGSATWGSLAAYGQTGPRTTKRIYGNRGNSFVAAVEFGPKVRAKSVLAGGVSGDPSSPYFVNQAERYARGEFKDVLFYREDVEKAKVRSYHPGDR
ncbi:penicillin acylase family protein [Roseisolibacter sp. H3M3-2]|uniref:penicillin acylase family protein n=1 Tax=Roseisolibacter sp. H3M3-2 TaxID=3031323 RepID=UPI0023DBCA89|nr:penicillin acylase family protein [Roseisolibacter sp. H3M3-2]MDF1502490.1 penicillin acylase family protein [Roseisolibacter sp. H3M3-2]